MARILHLVRHGLTAENLQGRFIGSSDVPLSAEGTLECEQLKNAIAQIQADHVLVSPLLRCRQTAQCLFHGQKVDMVEHPALAEINFGDWEGLTFGEIAEEHPVLTRSRSRLDEDFSFPGGESLQSFNKRLQELIKTFVQLEGDVVLAITHGGVIRHLLCQLLGLPRSSYLYFHAATASLTSMELHDGKGVLLQLNWRPEPLVNT